MPAYVIVEHQQGQLKACNFNVLSAARELKTEVVALVIGHAVDAVAAELAQLEAVDRVHVIDHLCYQQPLPERYSDAILMAIAPATADTWVLAPATSFGKALLPRVAARWGAAMVSEVVAIVDPLTFKRPIYAGNALATVRASAQCAKLLTIRATAFPPVLAKRPHPVSIENCTVVSNNAQSEFLGVERHGSGRPDLASAERVVAGGRGLQSPATFERLMNIADRLGAAVGASRAAVDSGLAPNDYQVGQTGQVVAPKLYFAVGISGAIQHIAGMKDSKIIVAINQDPDAPIFQVADYGLVADINQVLAEWEEALTELGY